MNRGTVLVVDDDPDVRDLTRALLEHAGHTVLEADGGRRALRELFTAAPALVILDITMPDIDGWTTLDRIRELTDVPVLMLSARDGEIDRVRGLNGGADDYVQKPFGHQELIARVNALLRRASGQARFDDVYSDALLTVDFAGGSVRVNEDEIRLTPLEFRLLCTLVRHPNQILSQTQLLELVWRDPYAVAPHQVRLYVGYLRRKLNDAAGTRIPIETVRGFGYRYRPSRELPAAAS